MVKEQRIIQLIGYPCVGKTKFLCRFFYDHSDWEVIDWADYNQSPLSYSENWEKFWAVFKKIKITGKNVIVESAMGFYSIGGSVIKFECSIEDLIERHKLRKKKINDKVLEYYNDMNFYAVKPDITINTSIINSYEKILDSIKMIL